ncbi:MAG TPA: hypothetical protein VIC05_00445 [Solirubrobacteraceae bacterium]|jgi:Na+-transporting methylmalonyl-CoA/oxaloacetate decarboxylase gamma subunit
MTNGLAVVVAVIIIVVVLVGLISTLQSSSAYDQIGRGGTEPSPSRGGGAAPAPRAASEPHDARQQEIREILTARSERLVRQGKEPLDIEAEIKGLSDGHGLSPPGAEAQEQHDPQLLAEARALIAARNERRLRAGLEALDVEEELARTLSALRAGGSTPGDHG